MTQEVVRDPLSHDRGRGLAPVPPTPSSRRQVVSWLATTAILACIGFLVLTVIGYMRFGSVGSALAYLRGEHLIPDEIMKSFGTTSQGERPAVEFRLRNCTGQPIKILGANVSCTCLEARDLPVVVPSNGETVLRVDVRTKGRSGPLSERLRLLTDSGEANFALNIRGTIQ